MRVPGDAELLDLWEHGRVRHPIDRALLMCAWARPDLPADRLADLPVGAVNAALLRWRKVCIGRRVDVIADCAHCGARLDLSLDISDLLANAPTTDDRDVLRIDGRTFRVPSTRDLASVIGINDGADPVDVLVRRCCVDPDVGPGDGVTLGALESGLDALDPTGVIELAVACAACGHRWAPELDISAVLWDEVDARAQALLTQVHELARAYGWTEPEILALSPARRAIYLSRVTA